LFDNEAVLLHELYHRINNEFAAAISAVSVAAARSSDQAVKAALSGVGELLHRYADVHRALQKPDDDTPVDAAMHRAISCLKLHHPFGSAGLHFLRGDHREESIVRRGGFRHPGGADRAANAAHHGAHRFDLGR
jgi:hypothetical protein